MLENLLSKPEVIWFFYRPGTFPVGAGVTRPGYLFLCPWSLGNGTRLPHF